MVLVIGMTGIQIDNTIQCWVSGDGDYLDIGLVVEYNKDLLHPFTPICINGDVRNR